MPISRRPVPGRAAPRHAHAIGGRPPVGPALCALAAVTGAALAGLFPGPVAGQVEPAPSPSTDTVRVVPGSRYEAGALRRLLDGDNHRDLWLRPLRVAVLDLDAFAGGLEPDHQGGNQSRTLHLGAPDGRTYIFRSTDKFVHQILPEDLRDTWTEDMMQDHVSVFHPAAGLVVPRIHDALGLLAVPGHLRVMPDDPRLGEHRETFAGMLGLVVERPNEGEGDRPLYGGYEKIVGTDELLDKLEDHPRNRVDAREYLAARLLDFLVGDTDRGPDQWRWAREPEPDGFRWRPITRDRDWAFVHADGLLAGAARSVFPKLVRFEDGIPEVEALTFADRGLGRRLLTSLDRAAWDAVVREVEAGVTDAVIDDAVALLPPEHHPDHAATLAARLKARRAELPAAATAFYERLATDVDVHATDRGDRAEILRGEDGGVTVTLYAAATDLRPVLAGADEGDEGDEGDDDGADDGADDGPAGGAGWAPYYRRTFRTGETREVRVFLHGGADTAVVRGGGAPAITVRVIGGGDDDALYDVGTGRGPTVLYDSRGENLLVPGGRTRVDTRPYEPPEPSDNFLEYQLGRQRDWGRERSWLNPALDYRVGAGLILGGGPTWTSYGFRRAPYASKVSVKALYGTGSGGFAVDAVGETRRENSPLALRLHVRASQFEAVRFYGLGNDTPELPGDAALIMQDRVLVEPSLVLDGARWTGAVGPVFRWTDGRVPAGNPALDVEAGSTGYAAGAGMAEVGARAALRYRRTDHQNVPRRGIDARTAVSAFPASSEVGPYAGASAELRGYLPVPVPGGPVLAVRGGARGLRGEAPAHDLAWIGGRTTLRGYPWQRFAGEAAVYGGAELRIPLVRANLGVARGRLGVLGTGDAGRVYVDGASPGGWHTSYGAGVFFATLDTAVHLVWARGEDDRLYAGLGMPF